MTIREHVKVILSNHLGIDTSEITPDADFHLDLNATSKELDDIKEEIEETLEITLPIEDEEFPTIVEELMEIVEDSCL